MAWQVNANADQESFDGKGLLPGKEYDIVCKALLHKDDREPDNIRFNYFAESCAIRLKDGTCSKSGCRHFKGVAPSLHLARMRTNLEAKGKVKT